MQLQLAERADSDGQRNVVFQRLHERLDRSTHLVHQLLTLARHEQHQALPTLVPAHADGLSVMLSNLVYNAVRYTQRGGQVDVSAGVEGGRAYLRVADSGPGVPEAERGRLFDRFYRPDGNAVWGCGLGLSIARNVVDGHGAAVELSSNGGAGLVVSVYFK